MTGRGRRQRKREQQAISKLVGAALELNCSTSPSPFSHYLPKSYTTPAQPSKPTEKTPKQSAPRSYKRKRAETPRWREYGMRSRQQVSYADADDSDDSAFYGSDDDGEEITALKKAKVERSLPKRKIFPFLSLPRELRDMIYEHAVGSSSIIITTTQDLGDGDPTNYGTAIATTTRSPIIRLCSREIGYRHTAQRLSWCENYYCTAEGRRILRGSWGATKKKRVECSIAPIATTLLRLNRQIYAEAAPVLYTASRFQFCDPTVLHTFVAALSPPTGALLGDIELLNWEQRRSYSKAYNHAAFVILAEGCVGVRAFRFRQGTYTREPKREARRVYRFAYPWLERLAAVRGGGVAEVLSILAKGVEEWGDEWEVGGEKWEVFSGEFVRLMALGVNSEGEEVENEDERDDEGDEYQG